MKIQFFSLELIALFLVLLHYGLSRTYTWRDLTQEELESWYSPTDLCVLNTSTTNSFPQDLRANECVNVSRGSRRVHCAVGMGNNNKPCYGPFSNGRPNFKRGVDGFTNASSKPLLKAFNYFIDHNTTMILLGD